MNVTVMSTAEAREKSKPDLYRELLEQLRALIADEPNATANLANCVALIYHSVPDLNWAGFYLLRGGELVLGPFQGKPACVRIPLGRGVCGTAAQERKPLRVPDVHKFPGHIACDIATRSELVIPLLSPTGRLFGVLDLDSPYLERFDEEDLAGLQRLAQLVTGKL